MNNQVLETRNLTKTFAGGVVAVSGCDLKVARGAVYGLVGRNGAGKTTLLRLLMGLLRPDSGSAHILGSAFLTAGREQRQRVAYVSQEQQVHAWMTLEELCHYVSHFYARWDHSYARKLGERFELSWERQVGLLSGGERRKVAILLALAACPEVLIMDEPAAGLDPIARRELIDAIIEILAASDGCTILFSTHIISDLERVADYVGIMERGRLMVSNSLEELQTQTRRVQLIFEGAQVPANFKLPGAIKVEARGPVLTGVVRMLSETQFDGITQQHKVRINVFPLGLEEILIELFGSEAARDSSLERMRS